MPGFQELLVIAVVALFVVGPERLPKLARDAGMLIARVRAEAQRGVSELRRVAEIQELEEELQGLRDEIRGVRADVLGTGGPARSGPPRRTPQARAAVPFDPEAT